MTQATSFKQLRASSGHLTFVYPFLELSVITYPVPHFIHSCDSIGIGNKSLVSQSTTLT